MHTVSLVNCIRNEDKLNDNSCYCHLPNLLGMNKSIEIVNPFQTTLFLLRIVYTRVKTQVIMCC